MIKKIYILFIIALLANTAFGQFVGRDHLSIALFYLQKSELDSAKKHIDLSIQDKVLSSSPKTWFYRGFIYKELYKTKEKENRISPKRLIAVESLIKLKKLDSVGEFTDTGNKTLKYLATTLYNDAVRLLDPENYEMAINNFNQYRDIMYVTNPNINLDLQDIKFKLALASMLDHPTMINKAIDSTLAYKIENLYLEVLAIDPNNASANYNIATMYYNKGAEIINHLDYDADLNQLNIAQDNMIEVFLKALPYMKKSYELNYQIKETTYGLKNIYHGLNDQEKEDRYKKELEDLEKEQ